MRSSFVVALLLTACTGSTPDDDKPADTGEADADTDTDTDTDADTDADTDTDTSGDLDRDADGYPASDDCDDRRADVHPGVTSDICNGRDDDCDSVVDEDPDLDWFPDADRDGYGKAGASSFRACAPDGDYASNDADCDDTSPASWPGADEPCDGADNDCDGEVDEDPASWHSFYRDDDGDGAGVDELITGCDAESAGGATNALDCDDNDRNSPVFVSIAGTATGSGRVDDPINSIQDAIAMGPSCVKVHRGTYVEDIDFGGRSLTVEGIDGSEATILVGTGASPVVTFATGESSDAVLRGFTISGGGGRIESSVTTWWDGTRYVNQYSDYAYGGGVYVVYASPTLEDLVISENLLSGSYSYYASSTELYVGGSYGGGLYVNGGDPSLVDVDFVANKAAYGGGVYHYYEGTITGTRVRMLENDSEYGSLYSIYGDELWENLILDANTSIYGYSGIYAYYTSLYIANATLVGNDYGIHGVDARVLLDSSVLAGNAAGLSEGGSGSGGWYLTYNNVYANGGRDYVSVTDPTGSDGNVSTAPGFEDFSDDGDADNDDLTLNPRSSMIDAGNPDVRDADGTRADVGAYGGPGGAGW